jgi:murein biosynthesis integral membrane protein MurJ
VTAKDFAVDCYFFGEWFSKMSQTLEITNEGETGAHKRSVNKQILLALLRLASAALLIRVIGMLNQAVVSARFGAGATMDAYFVAVLLPVLLGQLIVSAIEASVIPIYTRIRTQETIQQRAIFFNTLLNLLLVSALLLSLLMFVFRQQMIFVSAPALDAGRATLAVNLTPFIIPVLLLTVIIGFLESILNAEGQFGWPAYAGMLVPLTMVILVLVAGRSLGVVTLCIGMLAGQCLQLCVVIIRAKRIGLAYRPVIGLRNPDIAPVLLIAWPVLLGAIITQASPLVDQVVASFLSVGSISAINYSLKIVSVATGVIFVSVGRAVLPYLSRQASTDNLKAFKETLRLYLWILVIGVTALTIFMIVFAHPIVRILFQRGAFSADDTNRTASALIAFSIGLTPMALSFTLARAFGALGKTRVLMGTAIFSVFSNAVFDYIFARYWQSTGIALATSAVYVCNMLILLFTLRRIAGKLDLLTLPPEIPDAIQKITTGFYYRQLINWTQQNLSALNTFYRQHRLVILSSVITVVLGVGIVGLLLNPLSTLRIGFGILVILALLRYPYALLIAWALINAFIGAALPIISGNNILTALTVPLLLLMLRMPIRQTLKLMPSLAFLLIYLSWVLASIRISPLGTRQFLTTWATLLDYTAIVMLIINQLTTRRRLMGFIDAILLTSLLVSLYGLYVYVTRHAGIVDSTTGVLRMTSIYGAAPSLAFLLSVAIPLAIYRAFTLQGYVKRAGMALVILIYLLALGLTFTRGAFITVPLSLIAMVFFLPSRKMKIGVLGAIVGAIAVTILLATIGHLPLLGRFLNKDLITLNGRTYLWQALLAHFDPTHVLGYGLNASDALLAKLHISDSRGLIASAPHNIFLGALYDQGIIGLALLLLVFISLAISLVKKIRLVQVSPPAAVSTARSNFTVDHYRMLLAMAVAVFINIFLQSLESRDLWIHEVGLYFWMAMALPFARYWLPAKQSHATCEATERLAEASQQVEREQVPHTMLLQRDTKQRSSYESGGMRVCYISLMFSPIVGGAEIQTERQARELRALGDGAFVVTLRLDRRWKQRETLDGLPVVRVGGIYRRGGQLRIGRLGHIACDIALFLTLWRLRQHYDLIHASAASPLAAVAALVGKIAHKPVVISIQSTGPNEAQRALIMQQGAILMADTLPNTNSLKIDRNDWISSEGDITYLPLAGLGGSAMLHSLRKSKVVTYHTNSTRSYTYLTSHGFRAEQIIRIPHGVDTEKFQPAPERRPDVSRPERDIICVARLEYVKGIDVLLHAWGQMMHAPAEWHAHLKPRLRLVGTGSCRSHFEYIARELGIQDSVEFMGLRTDVVDLLQQAWGFVIPSRWESLPNALLEAMACGLPCVATRVSGCEDVISDGVNGLLVEPEQPVEMAEALRGIVEDAGLSQRMGQEARKTVVRACQLADVARQYQELYHDLLLRYRDGKSGAGVALPLDAHALNNGTASRDSTEIHAIPLVLEGTSDE